MVAGDYKEIPFYYIKGLWEDPSEIFINIKHENLQKIDFTRALALLNSDGVGRTGDPFEDVSATINFEGKTIPIKMSLKGDRIVHFSDKDKSSYRIKVKGENTLWGMKKFSIQKPRTRNYIHEWIFHQVLKREGLISLRYKFVNVTLNGKDLGLFAIEEHFGKHLIENNQQREGPILKFSEDYGMGLSVSPINPYEAKKWSAPEYIEQTNTAVSLLEGFRTGKMKLSEVFDTKKMAVYFAVTELLSVPHGTASKSMKFYYNPVTSKLEPIGFDGHFGAYAYSGEPFISLEAAITPIQLALKLGVAKYDWLWLRKVFDTEENFDEKFFREYIKALKRLSNNSYLNDLFKDLNDELEENLSLIYRDSPVFEDHIFSYGADLFTFSRDPYYKKQDYIRNLFITSKNLHIYYKKKVNEKLKLSLNNIQMFPLEIVNATYRDSLVLMPNEKTIIHPNPDFSRNNHQDVNFKLPKGFSWSDTMISDLKVKYRVLGVNMLESEAVYNWTIKDIDTISSDLMRRKPNVQEFPFLTLNDSTRSIFFKSGAYDIHRSIIIPEGYTVYATEGLEIKLYNGASILSYSPIIFKGSKGNPILFQSPDSTGQGLIVMKTVDQSLVDYVHFRNLANPLQGGWKLTSAVTFFESPVKITHCFFSQNRSEDALNILRTNFEIDHTIFKDIQSDALDSDFSNGRISNSNFINCGNDAIDISGSIVDIHTVVIDSIGDKGLSVGENSKMTANNIIISNAELAAVSKDLSTVIIEDINLYNCIVGFKKKKKKPEFGPASMTIKSLKTREVDVLSLIETKSVLYIDGHKIEGEKEVVEELLYGQKYGKNSN